MGLPSLFEDILDKQLDNLLRDQVGNGQFFSKDELKSFLRQMGVSASYLFAVNDEKLTEMWVEAVEKSNNLQVIVANLCEDLANEKDKYQQLRQSVDEKVLVLQLKTASSENDRLRKKLVNYKKNYVIRGAQLHN